MSDSTLYVLLGPSGAGKTTLGRHLLDWGIPELISHTTRPPREGEIEGINYYYVTEKQFEMVEMIESVEYAGNHYGTSKTEANCKMSNYPKCFVIADREGVFHYKDIFGEDRVKVIYIMAPPVVLMQRLQGRGDSVSEALKRMAHARETGELNNGDIADYIINNIDLEKSVAQLKKIMGVE